VNVAVGYLASFLFPPPSGEALEKLYKVQEKTEQ